jgi:hypothetical protein
MQSGCLCMVACLQHIFSDGAGTRRKEVEGDKAAASAKRARSGKDMLPPPPRASGAGKAPSKSGQAATGTGKERPAKGKTLGGSHPEKGPLVPLPPIQSVCFHAVCVTSHAGLSIQNVISTSTESLVGLTNESGIERQRSAAKPVVTAPCSC